MPSVLVEGDHESGKTTLASQIASIAIQNRWRTMYIHSGRGESTEKILDCKLEYINTHQNMFIICDRLFPSEYVYSIAEGRANTLGNMKFMHAWIKYGTPFDMVVRKRGIKHTGIERLYDHVFSGYNVMEVPWQRIPTIENNLAQHIYEEAVTTIDGEILRAPYYEDSWTDEDILQKAVYGIHDVPIL